VTGILRNFGQRTCEGEGRQRPRWVATGPELPSEELTFAEAVGGGKRMPV
jgi:hypothetical protein